VHERCHIPEVIEIGLAVVIGSALAAFGTLGLSVLFARAYDKMQSRRQVKPVIVCDESLSVVPISHIYFPFSAQMSVSGKTVIGTEIPRASVLTMSGNVGKELSRTPRASVVGQYPQVDPAKVPQSDNPFAHSYDPG
jgi:hypothetical protein